MAAKKTVRILRTLPLEGVIYQANDLVKFTADELKKQPLIIVRAWKFRL